MIARLPLPALRRTARPALNRLRLASLAALAGLSQLAAADEGMWPFDQVPVAAIQQRHGVQLSPEWLQRVRLAAVHFGGGSASLVSPQGLVLTNHHVARGCIARLSTAERDLDTLGFYAATPAQELRCPGTVLKVLMSNEDITAQVQQATAPASDDAQRNTLRKTAIADLERRCEQSHPGLKCQSVSLYAGAVYQLYRYKEWDDVRLVFAPDAQAANFGGDADNFVYPRFALDFSFVRVYEKGQPAASTGVLKLASQPVAEGDTIFVAGHPGSTDRLRTLTQLQFERDLNLPRRLQMLEAQQSLLHAYGKRSPEAARQATDLLAGIENTLKAQRGEYAALRDPEVFARKQQEEKTLREAWAAKGLSGDPWALVDRAVAERTRRYNELVAVNLGFRSLLASAGMLVDLARERTLPEAQRLSSYRDTALPQIERQLRAQAPVYRALEQVRLAFQLSEARRLLGAEHPFVQAALRGDTPEAAAERLISGSTLADPAARAALVSGGQAAVQASTDPMIVLARETAPLRRELAKFSEEALDTPLEKAAQLLGQARFALYGRSLPPDATGTLRLSYGKVAGYDTGGIATPWKTTYGGLLARADSFDNRPPFDLSRPIAAVRDKLDPRWPINFASTVDTIGGNSGSPMINARGELVGLIFDSNLEKLGGRYLYRDERARAIAVEATAIVHALETVYRADALVRELRGQ